MSQKSKRRRESRDVPGLNYRTLGVRGSSLNVEERSVEAVLTTESPVPMFDWERWEVIPEVLRMDGMSYPTQVPLLDSHNRYSIASQLGSIRDIRREAGEAVGRLTFSRTAEDEFTKVREGHVTDVSVGYRNEAVVHVPSGQKQVIGGREYSGPVNVVTKWRLHEASIVPIGADEQAKLRGFDSFPRQPKEFEMNEKLRALCVAAGMSADLSDDAAQEWMIENADKLGKKTAPPEPGKQKDPPVDIAALVREAVSQAIEARDTRQKAFRAQVDELCELAGMPGERANCYLLTDEAAVRSHLKAERAKHVTDVQPGFRLEGGAAQLEKHRGAVGTALVMRAIESTGCEPEKMARHLKKHLPEEKRARDWEQFRNASLFDLACECLRMDGFNLRGLSREDIAIAAIGWPAKVGLRAGDPAYHTTGSFPIVTQDAVNKSMQVGYEEFPATWKGPMRQGESVPDFKTIHRMRLGAVPNLPIWPDNQNPQQVSFRDAEETYGVEARSVEFSFSWRTLINDDMGVLSRTPFQLGNAASRTVNAAAWAVITGNPTMSDGVALFATATGNRKRSNLTAAVGAPSVSTVQTLTNLMMQMRGENTPEQAESEDILNLQPRYIVGPSALSTTIKQLVLSAYDPAANTFQVYNTTSELIPVIEPLLDASSATAWYLFASPAQIDTVEVTFLQGQETPRTRDWMDERSLAHCWAVLQTFGAKALNHRGVQKHNNV